MDTEQWKGTPLKREVSGFRGSLPPPPLTGMSPGPTPATQTCRRLRAGPGTGDSRRARVSRLPPRRGPPRRPSRPPNTEANAPPTRSHVPPPARCGPLAPARLGPSRSRGSGQDGGEARQRAGPPPGGRAGGRGAACAEQRITGAPPALRAPLPAAHRPPVPLGLGGGQGAGAVSRR